MKNKLIYATGFAFLVLMGVIFGCTTNGRDGSVYIAYTYSDVFSPYSLTVSDPYIPAAFYWDTEYKTAPQTVSYQYSYLDGTTYIGTYSLNVNYGQGKGLFKNGADGADKHLTFICSYYGTTFTGGPSVIIQPHPANTVQEGSVTMRDGDYTYHLTYKRSQLSPQQLEQIKSLGQNPLERKE